MGGTSLVPPIVKEGEGIEPPRPGGQPVFETGYRTNGSPSRWLRQESNLHHTA
jgi:hypothetical protein